MYHCVFADLSSGGYVFHLFQGKGIRFLKLCQFDPSWYNKFIYHNSGFDIKLSNRLFTIIT